MNNSNGIYQPTARMVHVPELNKVSGLGKLWMDGWYEYDKPDVGLCSNLFSCKCSLCEPFVFFKL